MQIVAYFHTDLLHDACSHTPPHVEETVPAAGATDGYPGEPVVVWLDEPFPPLPPESLQIGDENNVLVAGNLSALRREGGGFEPAVSGVGGRRLGLDFGQQAAEPTSACCFVCARQESGRISGTLVKFIRE